MAKRPESHSQKGFALIDAMIAVFVVGTGLAAAVDMISHMQVEMDMYKKYMLMGLLAQSKLEQLDAAAALPSDGAGDFAADYSLSTYTGITYTITVSEIPSAGLSGVPANLANISRKVEIEVKARDLRGKEHKAKMWTIKTIRGG